MEPHPEVGSANAVENIFSGSSIEKSFLMFVNGTSRTINCYWINFKGIPKPFQRLRPHGAVEVNTYRSHAWMFRDSYTGERMEILNKRVYVAEAYYMRHSHNPSEIVSARKVLTVHFPMRSLRENMLWYIVRESNCHSEKIIQEYDIPKVLKNDLSAIVRQVFAFRKT